MWPKRKQGQRKAWCISSPKNLTQWPWPWKSIGFQTHLRTKYVPSLVKIYWRMLHGKQIWPGNLDLWPWKSTGFQILLKTKHVPSLTKIHWRMLILVFTRQKLDPVSLTFDLYIAMTLKINRVPVSPKDYVYTKFGQNPLKDVDSSVHKAKIRPCEPNLWPIYSYDLENQ
jgi:hypothetical protein